MRKNLWIFGNPILTAIISHSEITQKLNKVKGRYFVYCLLKGDEIIYVGRSINLACRLAWHKYRKDFTDVAISEYETYKECCKAEKQITKYYMPIENLLWVKYA
jgi:predicted GIY-YIG superfamily endonuclease